MKGEEVDSMRKYSTTKRLRSAERKSFAVKGKEINRLQLRGRPGRSRSYANG